MFQVPDISVIIPTLNRPHLVGRAVLSALRQTFSNIEVIVVIDGPDSESEQVLSQIQDKRLKIVPLKNNQGAPHARNHGIQIASGRYIALLDDDDEWHFDKLQMQLGLAKASQHKYPVVGCRLYVQTLSNRYVTPRRLPREQEHISDYLYARRSIFHGEGCFTTSMLFTSRELLLLHPFNENLRRQQEADWLLRVFSLDDTSVLYVNAILGVQYVEANRSRISETGDWQYSFEWIRERRSLVTPTAYSAFILLSVGSIAAHERSGAAFFILLHEALTNGRPLAIHLVLFLGMWLIPRKLRRSLRENILKGKHSEQVNHHELTPTHENQS